MLRWRDIKSPDELSASDDWWELWDRTSLDRSLQSQFSLTGGILDRATAASLRRTLSGLELWSAHWVGYGAPKPPGAHLSTTGEHWVCKLSDDELVEGLRVPQYCWDESGVVEWTSLPYPDSLILSGTSDVQRRMFEDPWLDLATLMRGDVLPPSAAD